MSRFGSVLILSDGRVIHSHTTARSPMCASMSPGVSGQGDRNAAGHTVALAPELGVAGRRLTVGKADWKASEDLAVGKGATVQEFVATVGADTLEIHVAPWGEGHLKVNGRQIAHIKDAKDRR